MELNEQDIAAIKAEEETLQAIHKLLEEQLYFSRRKLGQESARARELTAELVSAQQVDDKQLLASDEAVAHALSKLKISDIKTIEKLLEQPYFGRVVVEEKLDNGKIKEIEYKLGKFANPDCRIIDWRKAPISKLYYEYKEGDEFSEMILGRERNGKILLRNSVEIKNGKLLALTCSFGSFRQEKGHWIKLRGNQSARSAGNYEQLPDILALITPEQFDLITNTQDSALLIQGIAGSGKTSVALHRIAWLLDPSNSDLKAKNVLILVPTPALRAYTQLSIRSLGIEELTISTTSDWYSKRVTNVLPAAMLDEAGQVFRPNTRPEKTIQRVYQSIALLSALEVAAERSLIKFREKIKQEWSWTELPPSLLTVYEKACETSRDLPTFYNTIYAAIERGITNLNSSNPIWQKLKSLTTWLDENIKPYNALNLVKQTLNDPQTLISKDSSRLLTPEIINLASKRFETLLHEKQLDSELYAIILRAAALTFVAPDKISNKYQHIFVDEVQDLSVAELAVVLAAVKESKDLTLAGDIAQRTQSELELSNWQDVTGILGLKSDTTRLVSLTVSHRSTQAIMRLADHIQDRALSNSGRTGKAPIHFVCANEQAAIKATLRWLETALERYPNSLSAVICENSHAARQMFSMLQPGFGGAVQLLDQAELAPAGILVSYPEQVKGLEFFNVLVFDASADIYPTHDYAKNRLYINVTRAEENLCLVNWKTPSRLLPAAEKRLLRYFRAS